jgi:hypothetical protein
MMAHPKFLIAPSSLHVDAADEATARAILDEFLAAAAVEASRIRWEPYAKLGPHSRLSFFALIPDRQDDAAIIAEIERICACLVGEDAHGKGHTMDFITDGGDRHYERIFDRRIDGEARFFPRTHWFDIELDLYTPVQQRLRKLWREDRGVAKPES